MNESSQQEYPIHRVYYINPFGFKEEIVLIFKAGIPTDKFYLCKSLIDGQLLNLHESSLIIERPNLV